MTETTSAILSGLLASSHPQLFISAALARQAQVGVGEIPNRFKSLESSVPGPLSKITSGSVKAGHFRIDPQNASYTPHTVQALKMGSHKQ
jgi:hypothetical protein